MDLILINLEKLSLEKARSPDAYVRESYSPLKALNPPKCQKSEIINLVETRHLVGNPKSSNEEFVQLISDDADDYKSLIRFT